ncbi:ATP-binding protein [Amycolatopsis sp. NPDC051758]|uniref:ATP-binding protein n=1 Tax=Amycolatopsis sp. NPDC051758 TaxID=3363935 RepID=UPI003794F8CD
MPSTLRLVLAADWISPSVARSRLRDWLEAHRWPEDEVDDLVLAVSEAVSNSIEHGYGVPVDSALLPHPGQIEVTASVKQSAVGARHIELTIRDAGTWREPGQGPRGYGLDLMRAAGLYFVVERSAEGTRIRFTSRPVADIVASPPEAP